MKIQYNRNRYYDYYTGRWLTHDPLGITPNPKRPNISNVIDQYIGGLSLYQYVNSNPVIKRDPYGLYCWTDADGIYHCQVDDPANVSFKICWETWSKPKYEELYEIAWITVNIIIPNVATGSPRRATWPAPYKWKIWPLYSKPQQPQYSCIIEGGECTCYWKEEQIKTITCYYSYTDETTVKKETIIDKFSTDGTVQKMTGLASTPYRCTCRRDLGTIFH